MTIEFDIIKPLNLMYVRYRGSAKLAESADAADACARHPDFHPGMPQLFDLSEVTEFETDYARFFALQAKLLDDILPKTHDQLVVFVAPMGPPLDMANLVRRSWVDQPRMCLRVVNTEAEALDILAIRADTWRGYRQDPMLAEKNTRR